jgi:hypothetical protein
MRKKLLAFLLAAVSHGAAAAWIPIVESDDGVSFYVDSSATLIGDDTVRVRQMINYNTEQGKTAERGGYLSGINVAEYDCVAAQHRQRILSIELHTGSMGAGNIIRTSYPPADWQPIAADSVSDAAWRIVCNSKNWSG